MYEMSSKMVYRASDSEADVKSTDAYLPSIVSSY
jgi:hypothetical protein